MTQLSTGVLADVPVKFKIDDAWPNAQGSGENAHLYFKAGDEEKVYKAITERIYPALESLVSDTFSSDTFSYKFLLSPSSRRRFASAN